MRDLESIAAELRNEEDALELQQLVKEFFNTYLNRVEESDEGRLYNPIFVSCSRSMMVQPLGELLEKMRVLSGADENPLFEDYHKDNNGKLIRDDNGEPIPLTACICFAREPSECVCGAWDGE